MRGAAAVEADGDRPGLMAFYGRQIVWRLVQVLYVALFRLLSR